MCDLYIVANIIFAPKHFTNARLFSFVNQYLICNFYYFSLVYMYFSTKFWRITIYNFEIFTANYKYNNINYQFFKRTSASALMTIKCIKLSFPKHYT